jgi:Predicted integral membrane protein (DUF2269)
MHPALSTVNGYNISLWLHITAVMVGFGSTFALAIATPVALKLDPRHLPYVHQLSLSLNRYFASPALIVVLATGFYEVSKGNWNYDFWVVGTLVIVVLLGGIMGMVFMPSSKALKDISEREIAAADGGPYTPSDQYNRRARAEMIAGPITGLLLVAAVFLMVTKIGT